MLVINRLTKAGDIKKLVVEADEVTVTTQFNQVIVYRRIDDNTQSS